MTQPKLAVTRKQLLAEVDKSRYTITSFKELIEESKEKGMLPTDLPHISFDDFNPYEKDSLERMCPIQHSAYFPSLDIFAFYEKQDTEEVLKNCKICKVSNNCLGNKIAEHFPEDLQNEFLKYSSYVEFDVESDVESNIEFDAEFNNL